MADIAPMQNDVRIARSVWTARASAPLSPRKHSQPVLACPHSSFFRGSNSFPSRQVQSSRTLSNLVQPSGEKIHFPSRPRTPHPNATVALRCETLHWVATGLSHHQITGSTASNRLGFKGFQARQTEVKPRQTKKLNSGRVALGCRILSFLRSRISRSHKSSIIHRKSIKKCTLLPLAVTG